MERENKSGYEQEHTMTCTLGMRLVDNRTLCSHKTSIRIAVLINILKIQLEIVF